MLTCVAVAVVGMRNGVTAYDDVGEYENMNATVRKKGESIIKCSTHPASILKHVLKVREWGLFFYPIRPPLPPQNQPTKW